MLVHKFVCRGTVEERIDRMIADKRALAGQLVEGGGGEALLTEMDDNVRPFAQPRRAPRRPYDFHWHGLMGYNDSGIRVIGSARFKVSCFLPSLRISACFSSTRISSPLLITPTRSAISCASSI